MGRFKTNQEREAKAMLKTVSIDNRTDEEKEAEESKAMFEEIRQVPGWTGDVDKDSLNPGIQDVVRRRSHRKKV